MKTESIKTLKKKLERVFNDFIRWRDWKKGCISCGVRMSWRREWQAGHFYPVSTTYAALRYDEQNVNGQCAYCNKFLEGNKESYRRGLIARYGESVIEKLDIKRICSQGNVWTRFHYEALILDYKRKLKDSGFLKV